MTLMHPRTMSATIQIFLQQNTKKTIFVLFVFLQIVLVQYARRRSTASTNSHSHSYLLDLNKVEYKGIASTSDLTTVLFPGNEASTEAFELSTGDEQVQDAYNLALEEVRANIHQDNHFVAGAGWTQLWTRDTSYAVELGAGVLHPTISQSSLIKCTEHVEGIGTVWLQDTCGHFGGWPNLTDAIAGARGAWSLYLINGDKSFALWAYNVTKNSLLRAEQDAYDSSTGLFKGCSSFMESNSGYPAEFKHNGEKVGQTKALSTNMLYYDGYHLASRMGNEVGVPLSEIMLLERKAKNLKKVIRERLWRSDLGYYSYMEDANNITVDQMEGLGESLVLLSDDFEMDQERIDAILLNTPTTSRGLPCLWPRFQIIEKKRDIASYYHNGRIWPFVQGYWAIAAARHSKLDVFERELKSLVALSRVNNTFAEFYELNGSFPFSRSRQLWSGSGFLGMVYYGLFGITFTLKGIEIRPIKPSYFAKTISLRNISYRNMNVDIHVSGFGSNVKLFKLDGVVESSAFIPDNLNGQHLVEVTLE